MCLKASENIHSTNNYAAPTVIRSKYNDIFDDGHVEHSSCWMLRVFTKTESSGKPTWLSSPSQLFLNWELWPLGLTRSFCEMYAIFWTCGGRTRICMYWSYLVSSLWVVQSGQSEYLVRSEVLKKSKERGTSPIDWVALIMGWGHAPPCCLTWLSLKTFRIHWLVRLGKTFDFCEIILNIHIEDVKIILPKTATVVKHASRLSYQQKKKNLYIYYF